MLTQSDLVASCRSLDALTADGVPVDAVLIRNDVDPRAAAYVAEWRALRIALLYDGWTETEVDAMSEEMRPNRMRLSLASQFWMPAFSAIYLDGLTSGLLLHSMRTRSQQ